jgi:hypothetical protein
LHLCCASLPPPLPPGGENSTFRDNSSSTAPSGTSFIVGVATLPFINKSPLSRAGHHHPFSSLERRRDLNPCRVRVVRLWPPQLICLGSCLICPVINCSCWLTLKRCHFSCYSRCCGGTLFYLDCFGFLLGWRHMLSYAFMNRVNCAASSRCCLLPLASLNLALVLCLPLRPHAIQFFLLCTSMTWSPQILRLGRASEEQSRSWSVATLAPGERRRQASDLEAGRWQWTPPTKLKPAAAHRQQAPPSDPSPCSSSLTASNVSFSLLFFLPHRIQEKINFGLRILYILA